MNANELKAERIRKGKTMKEMADALSITYDAYVKKERGSAGFSAEQIVVVTYLLDLNADLINRIFFDNKLPIGRKRKAVR